MVDYSSMARGSPIVLALVKKEPEARICRIFACQHRSPGSERLGLEVVAAKVRGADGTGK
jgi:hypothetical protein